MEISKGKLQTEVKKTDFPSPVKVEDSGSESVAYNVTDKDEKYAVCRVCQCVESDNGGDVVLGFLGIVPPSQDALKINESGDDKITVPPEVVKKTPSENESMPEPGFIEFISPDGEIFICRNDVEASSCYQPDILINLGCSCKSDLALAHYACALKWFVNHGSSVCEICGTEAKYIRPEDIKKVMASIDENESLVSGIATGECSHVRVKANAGVDPDAIAAIRRQRLSEISMWFNLSSTSAMNSQVVTDQPLAIPSEDVVPSESLRTKWAVEGTAILVATGLLTVTLAWLIAPRVGKIQSKTRSNLDHECLKKLVFIKYNKSLHERFEKRRAQNNSEDFDPIRVEDLNYSSEWMTGKTGAFNEFIYGEEGLSWADKTARNGLHILLGGICALTLVIFLRFILLSRIKYGPARYWAILFVFWFLVFGIWASRTHGAHTT